ncbi:chitinase 9 [Morus notabilis]|uniref:chitinase 9 n=1 Tax=Morus notabilis TaxID=981085 RepID=UPI000CED077B|nr:chitinase 9 [Morus notabilis]
MRINNSERVTHYLHGCQSQCDGDSGGSGGAGGGGGGGGVRKLLSEELFEFALRHRNDRNCPARGFYTYDSFVEASKDFPAFGTTGDKANQLGKIATFLAQTSHETTDGILVLDDAKTRNAIAPRCHDQRLDSEIYRHIVAGRIPEYGAVTNIIEAAGRVVMDRSAETETLLGSI